MEQQHARCRPGPSPLSQIVTLKRSFCYVAKIPTRIRRGRGAAAEDGSARQLGHRVRTFFSSEPFSSIKKSIDHEPQFPKSTVKHPGEFATSSALGYGSVYSFHLTELHLHRVGEGPTRWRGGFPIFPFLGEARYLKPVGLGRKRRRGDFCGNPCGILLVIYLCTYPGTTCAII